MNSGQFRSTKNSCFEAVIDQCSHINRGGQQGTWITNDMKQAYIDLHQKGFAKSYEVWENNNLVGGLYGVDLGHVFCGESMFSLVSNASKYAFIELALELGIKKYAMIDCQMHTEHLQSLGAESISRESFLQHLKNTK